MPYLFFFFFILMFSNKLSAQFKIKDSCGDFILHIKAKNLTTDTIKLFYRDCNENKSNHTIILSHGMASYKGNINRATEGIIFTDPNEKMWDGPRVIRFIIEPSEMTLQFDLIKNSVKSISSTGSVSQKEKEAFEEDNSLLFNLLDYYYYHFLPPQSPGHDNDNDSTMERYLKESSNKIAVLYELLIAKVLKYVRENPNSYYSGYLLNHYKRKIPLDTLQKYFVNLPCQIIYSDFGKNFLEEIFKLSDNQFFRQKFADSALFHELNRIKTVYDISLLNSAGTKTSFSQFKDEYILIDFWASWCGPCFQNIPALEELMNQMKKKPIKFVSVCLDSDTDTWKKSIVKHDFPGTNLFDENGLLSTFYKVLWVPRYIIINPDGTVANMDAPQPVDPKLKLILDDLLRKNNDYP